MLLKKTSHAISCSFCDLLVSDAWGVGSVCWSACSQNMLIRHHS